MGWKCGDRCGSKDTDFVLALRIPDWCGGNYTVDGIEKDEMSEKDGYLYVKKAGVKKMF